MLEPRRGSEQCCELRRIRRQSALRSLAADVNLDQHGQTLAGSRIQLLGQVKRVDGIDAGEDLRCLGGLVGLQVADEVKLDPLQIGKLRRLLRELLHAVFSE